MPASGSPDLRSRRLGIDESAPRSQRAGAAIRLPRVADLASVLDEVDVRLVHLVRLQQAQVQVMGVVGRRLLRDEADAMRDALYVPETIASYVDHYQPFDKAGSYGAQECLPEGFNPCSAEEMEFLRTIKHEDLVAKSITRLPGQGGMNAIRKIEGSYFNVMGLPVHRVYRELERFNVES